MCYYCAERDNIAVAVIHITQGIISSVRRRSRLWESIIILIIISQSFLSLSRNNI